jgi:SAM-dependent methyltransferase
MNRQEFGVGYADNYDALYQDKDYETECNLLEEAFRRYAVHPVKTILDLGCGTGNHAIPLSRRGYELVGVDRSQEMLDQAKKKAVELTSADAPHRPEFLEGDVRDVDVNRQFDAVLMMFAVLGYQLTNPDVMAALKTVSRHLRPGGVFICDVWYGPAVLTIRPGDRVKILPTEDGKLIRAASGSLNVYDHLAEVRYHILRLQGTQVLSDNEERHFMRYFFPQELILLMGQAQLTMCAMSAFGNMDQKPSENTWNVLVVGQKS